MLGPVSPLVIAKMYRVSPDVEDAVVRNTSSNKWTSGRKREEQVRTHAVPMTGRDQLSLWAASRRPKASEAQEQKRCGKDTKEVKRSHQPGSN